MLGAGNLRNLGLNQYPNCGCMAQGIFLEISNATLRKPSFFDVEADQGLVQPAPSGPALVSLSKGMWAYPRGRSKGDGARAHLENDLIVDSLSFVFEGWVPQALGGGVGNEAKICTSTPPPPTESDPHHRCVWCGLSADNFEV